MGALKLGINEWLRDSEKLLHIEAELDAPKHTGSFAKSLQTETINEGTDRRIELFSVSENPKPHWTWEGYTITPKKSDYLVFQTYDGGWHKRKSVFHRPNHWREFVVENITENLIELVESRIVEALERAK